jgi:hypothetical protein
MKFVEPNRFTDPEVAARKLLEIANSVEPVQDGRIHIEKINWPMLHDLKASPAEYGAGRQGLTIAQTAQALGLHPKPENGRPPVSESGDAQPASGAGSAHRRRRGAPSWWAP